MKKYFFYIILFLIILLGFFLLVPKVATRLFPFERSPILNAFISDSKKNQKIDGRQFWMMREYFSPGAFTFKKEGYTINEVRSVLSNLDVSIKANPFFFPFLVFHSDRLESVEALTETNKLNQIFFSPGKNKNCIIDQTSTYMCYKDSHTLTIIFIKPMKEMMVTNGFYDYKTDEVRRLTNDRHWLVISKIRL